MKLRSLLFPAVVALAVLLGVMVTVTLHDILLWPAANQDAIFVLALLSIAWFYCLWFVIILSPWCHLVQAPRRGRVAFASTVLGIGVAVIAASYFPDLARPDFEIRHRQLLANLHGSAQRCATFIAEQASHPLPSVLSIGAPAFYTDDELGSPRFILAYAMHPDNMGGGTVYYDSISRQWRYHNHADCDCCTQTCPSVALRETVSKMKQCLPES